MLACRRDDDRHDAVGAAGIFRQAQIVLSTLDRVGEDIMNGVEALHLAFGQPPQFLVHLVVGVKEPCQVPVSPPDLFV